MRDGLDRCWNRTGVGGDASCERLAAIGHCRNCGEYSRAGRALLDREASDALRHDWTRALAEAKPATSGRGESVVVFWVGGEYLALYTVLLERVTDRRPVHCIPGHGNAVFTGVVNIDGELLPCFSAAAAVHPGDEPPPPESGRLLVLQQAGVRLVCAVDQVAGVVRVAAADLQPPPVTLARNARAFTTAVFPVRGQSAGLLDGAKFVESLMRSAG